MSGRISRLSSLRTDAVAAITESQDLTEKLLEAQARDTELTKQRDEARKELSRAWGLNCSLNVQIAMMGGVRSELEARISTLEKERDALALLLQNNRALLLRRFSVAEHDTEFHLRSECTCPDCEDYRNLEPIEEFAENIGRFLAAHDTTIRQEARRAALVEAADVVVHRAYPLSYGPDHPKAVADLHAELMFRSRGTTDELRKMADA